MSGYPVEITNSKKAYGLMSDPSATTRTEIGVGALMVWADKLWYSTYLAMPNQGAGSVIGTIDKNGKNTVLVTHNSVHAARFVHYNTNKMFFGHLCVNLDGSYTEIPALKSVRVTAWVRSFTAPSTNVWAITMEGVIYNVTIATLACTQIYDMATTLGITAQSGNPQPHFKSAWKCGGTARFYACSNVNTPYGRFGHFDGSTWTSILQDGMQDVISDTVFNYVYALGQDALSSFVAVANTDGSATCTKYRIPQRTNTQRYYINQEWMRFRPIQTERYMFNAWGTWFEMASSLDVLPSATPQWGGIYGTNYPVINPVATYLDTVTDFTVFNGQFVYGTNNNSEQQGQYPTAGQSTACIKFVDLEELWRGGKPIGSGYVWYKNSVNSGVKSDAMLCRGYDKKTFNAFNNTGSSATLTFTCVKNSVQYTYPTTLTVPANSFATFQFPDGFSCDWVHVSPGANITNITGWFEFS